MRFLERLRNWWNGLDEERRDEVRPPDGMSRRNFLRAMGVTSTAVYLGGSVGNSLWRPEAKTVLAAGPQVIGPHGEYAIPFQCLPQNLYIRGPRYRVAFDRIVTPRYTELQAVNQALFEQLAKTAPDQAAIDAVNDFTRMKLREDGFFRKIMPPVEITNDELTAVADKRPLNRAQRRAAKFAEATDGTKEYTLVETHRPFQVRADLGYQGVKKTPNILLQTVI